MSSDLIFEKKLIFIMIKIILNPNLVLNNKTVLEIIWEIQKKCKTENVCASSSVEHFYYGPVTPCFSVHVYI